MKKLLVLVVSSVLENIVMDEKVYSLVMNWFIYLIDNIFGGGRKFCIVTYRQMRS